MQKTPGPASKALRRRPQDRLTVRGRCSIRSVSKASLRLQEGTLIVGGTNKVQMTELAIGARGLRALAGEVSASLQLTKYVHPYTQHLHLGL